MSDGGPDHGRRRVLLRAGRSASIVVTGGIAGVGYSQLSSGGLDGLPLGVTPAQAAAARSLGGVLNVRDFGARGDGEKDDTSAFKSAFKAVGGSGGCLMIPPGTYPVHELEVPSGIGVFGTPGKSILRYNGRRFLLAIEGESDVRFQDIVFDGAKRRPLQHGAPVVVHSGSKRVLFERCIFERSSNHGISIEDASCTISGCVVRRADFFGVYCNSREPVQIVGSEIVDIGNNGIRVERPRPESVRVVIAQNVISRIKATDGGDGPNGNGINVFRAHDVLVSGNHITDCAFSGFRSFLGHGARVTDNHFEACRETTLYVEYGASRAVVTGNQLHNCRGDAIRITNFDEGGHVAVCADNIISNVTLDGIFAEADTLVRGNIIDGARRGIIAGYGPYMRNVVVEANLIQDTRKAPKKRLEYGILIERTSDAGNAFVTNNRVFNFTKKAIYGHIRERPGPLNDNVYLAHNFPGVARGDLSGGALPGSINYEPDTRVQRYSENGRWRRF